MANRFAKILFFGLLLSGIAFAEEEKVPDEEEKAPDWSVETLTGNWGGGRSSLYEKGVTVELTHKSDFLENSSGGIKRGSVWLANSEIAVNMDMGKLAGWNATTVFVQYHVQHGDQTKDFNGSYVGSFAGVDNIETGTNTGQFYQAWLQKNSADDSLSLLAGLYAVDSEFYVTDTSGLFIQPPYGMSAEMAPTGQNGDGPPVFPLGALAVRVKYASSGFYAQGVLTDGIPGNPNNPHGTHIRLGKGDGSLAVVELGYNTSEEGKSFNKTAVGLWRYSARANDLVDVDALGNPIRRTDQGFYLLAERTLRAEQNDPAQGLSGFVRFGAVNQDVYQTDWSGSLGLQYQGLFDGRDDDTAGIAVTNSHASSKYRQLNVSDSSETVVEVTYRAQLKPWLAVQPMVQRIINPNMDTTLRDAWVAGMRLEVAF
ncbi:MAG: carbohydrate porin [Gallionella sp.]|nr:carbohydrate porin [Gallionella sp.]